MKDRHIERRCIRGFKVLQAAREQHGEDYTACDLVTDVLHTLHSTEDDLATVLLLLNTAKGHFLNELAKEAD